MDRWIGDVRHAARRLRRAPGFALAVIVLLALGVGANAAVFSVLRATVLVPPDYPELERIVLPLIHETALDGEVDRMNWSWPEFVAFREASPELWTDLAGYAARTGTVSDPGDAETMGFEFVSDGYFRALGLQPVVGGFFTPDDHVDRGGSDAVVVTYGFWQSRFGEDVDAVGRYFTVDGTRYRIAGVVQPGFRGLTGSASFFLPMVRTRDAFGDWLLDDAGVRWMHAIGKLAPGLSAELAVQRGSPILRSIDEANSFKDDGEISLDVAPLSSSWTTPTTRRSIWLTMAAAGAVLLIAIANVGALLLTRARREAGETAVRLAMGAGRGRLVRERLVESLLLSLTGGAAGLVLAGFLVNAVRGAIPASLLRGSQGEISLVGESAIQLDLAVAAFGIGVASVAGILFGVIPELLRGTVDLAPALRSGGARGSVGGQRRGGRFLVSAQVGISVVLVVAAGLFLRTLGHLHDQQRGFDPEGLLALRYTLASDRPRYESNDARAAFHAGLRERLEGLPGVTSTAVASTPPLGGHSIRSTVRGIVGEREFERGEQPLIGVHQADAGVFRTLGARIVEGRGFSEEESNSPIPVAVVNRKAVEEIFDGESPIGREIDASVRYGEEQVPFRVIGVVEDVLYGPPTEGVTADMFVSSGMLASWVPTILVRTDGDPAELVPLARAALAEMDPSIAFWQATTGAELRRSDVADTRLLLGVLGAFALLALVVSSAGLWAVVAQAVAERRREIGVRVALGAGAGSVEALVFRQGLAPILLGALAGIAVALAFAPRVSELLFEVDPRDPTVFIGATAILGVVALLATWLPARRAARVDPVEALAGD